MASNQVDEEVDSNVDHSKSDTLTNMNEEEISQHLALCLKLDAENKINVKNAFGLHLIDILRHKVKHDTPDLQAASMSLQASSKIYAGRVDALYKETFAFHYQLQTMVSNKKVVEAAEEFNDGEDRDPDDDPKERRKTKTKQTFIVSEESVSLKSESTNKNSLMPHANFIAIKSAFTASRTAPKLLERLPLKNDTCELCCTTALPCFMPITATPVEDFSYPAKRKKLIQKIQNMKFISSGDKSSAYGSDVFAAPSPKSPPFEAPAMDVSSDDSLYIGSPVRQQQDSAVEDIIDKFSVLDITAEVLAKDLSMAIVDANTVDRNRLPPNSALKRVLNTAEKTKPKTPAKVRKEKPPRVPFFSQERVVDKSIFKKGHKTELKESESSQWNLTSLTEGSIGPKLFSTLLVDSSSSDSSRYVSKTMFKLMEDNMQSCDGYLCKELQLWNKHGKKSTQLIRPSSFGVCLNGNDSNELRIENSNYVVESFQNLSLQNSPARSDDYADDNMPPPDADYADDSFVLNAPMQDHLSRSGLFEDDLNSVMVTAPEMAQPIIMRFETQPITLSTEATKNAIWNIVEKGNILLSEMYKELQNVFVGEFMPLQYIFTTLLILANEKCLRLENVSEEDIMITQDVLE